MDQKSLASYWSLVQCFLADEWTQWLVVSLMIELWKALKVLAEFLTGPDRCNAFLLNFGMATFSFDE